MILNFTEVFLELLIFIADRGMMSFELCIFRPAGCFCLQKH